MNVTELITALKADNSISQGDRLQMFVSLVDGETLKRE